jgi:hypothetical protein
MTRSEASLPHRGKRREIAELAIAYGLILLVCWTPRPWQRWLWVITAATVAVLTCRSFEGLKAMGLRGTNLLRSMWVPGVALLGALAGGILAARMLTLRLPGGPLLFVKTYAAYAIWAFVQQFLQQCFVLSRLLRILPSTASAAMVAAIMFSVAHLPNPILTPITLLWGVTSCWLFLRYCNLYPLALAHAIVGIAIAVTIPGPVTHNMRVGLGYLTYGHAHKPIASPQP